MKILYSMSALFPFGTADASRVSNICKLLKHAGNDVVVFCDVLSDPSCRTGEKEAEYEGVHVFYSFPQRTMKYKLTNTIVTPRNIDKYISSNKVDLIIASHAESRFHKILRIAQKHSIPIILESNEKYHYSNWTLGRLDYRYYQFLLCWNKYYLRTNGIIAISSFLEQYYLSHSKKVFRMPTIIDVNQIEARTSYYDADKIKIVFSGGLGKGKDRLVELIEAMHQCKGKTKRSIYLNVYGPSKEAVETQLGNKAWLIEELKESIHFAGRIPQQEVLNKVRENDFGVILRPNRESSNAGFPTKLAEYMSVGTPVIANATSDLNKYINGTNGFIMEQLSTNILANILLNIADLDADELTKMRINARKTAEESFDYRLYSQSLNDFISRIVN